MASLAYEPSGTNEHRSAEDVSEGIFTASTGIEATILLASMDPDIRASMSALLDSYNVKAVSVTGLEELRLALAKETVSACFCGFWLVDGTYRDVVRQLRRQPMEIPVIVVCAPGCSQEYRDYLAALNMRAFDYICHPYRKADLERILHSVVSAQHPGIRSRDTYSATLGAGSGKLRAV
jgi:DNA-binding NtrC family response regulator